MKRRFELVSLALTVFVTMGVSCSPNNTTTSIFASSDFSPSTTVSENSPSSTSQTSISSTVSSSISLLPDIDFIKVFVKDYTHIYAWTESGSNVIEHTSSWPGDIMERYDSVWYSYNFSTSIQSVNIVFNNNGAPQTADLSVSGNGYHWYYDGKWSHSKNYGGDFDEGGNDDSPSDGDQLPFDPIEADSYLDFKFWDEYDPSYFTVLDPYQGIRNDFRDETIYFAITTRFYDGDTSNNVKCWDGRSNSDSDPAWRGDFKGLIDKLDYIKALGFTAVWITPVVENASGYDYHGYHAMNMSAIDSRYESDDVDFSTLIQEIHKKDMKLILDVVFNHTGNFGETNLFPMFEKSGDPSSFDSMKVLPNSGLPSNYNSLNSGQQYDARIANMKNTRNDGSDPNNIYHHHGNFSWETFGEQVAQIAGDCVDLNTENPLVAEYLVKVYGEFIRMGVDYFRIDTMKHVSRLTLNNYIIPGLYEYARRCGANDFYMFGEVCTRVREVWNHNIPALSSPFYTWKEEKDYPWGDTETNLKSIEVAYEDNKSPNNEPTSLNAKLNGRAYHQPDYRAASGVSVIDFPMHWNFYYANNAFRVAKENDQYYNDATYNVVYVDSHDYSPDECQRVRYNRGTDAWAENMSLMFTFRGVPCLYYGSEIEFQKGKVIDDGPNVALAETGRAYFGDYLEGQVRTDDFASYTASGKVKETLSSTLSQHLQKLNMIRSKIPALRKGQYTTEGVDGDIAFIRRYTDTTIDSFACVTISGKATFNNIPNGIYVDMVSGKRIEVQSNRLTTDSITTGNARIFVLENAQTGTLTQIGSGLTYLK